MPIFRRENGKLEAVAGNYAILDNLGRIPYRSMPAYKDRYYNHTGVTDNFMIDETYLGGSVTENVDTHSKDISTADAESSAVWRTKTMFHPSNKPTIFSVMLKNIVVAPYCPLKSIVVGLLDSVESWEGEYLGTGSYFIKTGECPYWQIVTQKEIGDVVHKRNQIIDEIVDGDVLSLHQYLNRVEFYVNGVLLTFFENVFPEISVPLSAGVGVYQYASIGSICSVNVDNFEYERVL